jgi:HTH-type transcriptional regulator, competence development regulator
MTFGTRLRQLRLDRRLNQKELAARVGIDFTYLSKLENDRMEPPGEETIQRLAAALSADATELMLLARKVPSDLKPIITQSPLVPQFLRTAHAQGWTEADWKRLIEDVERAHSGPGSAPRAAPGPPEHGDDEP